MLLVKFQLFLAFLMRLIAVLLLLTLHLLFVELCAI